MSITIEDVIEYLSKTKSPVQLVKHYDEVIEKHKTYPMGAQVKHDGVYCLAVVIDEVVKLYGRTGLKLYWQADEVLVCGTKDDQIANFNTDPHLKDGVYIGEFCNAKYTLEQLSGFLNPNRKKEWEDEDFDQLMTMSDIYMHDYLTFDELLGGHSERPYIERHKLLSKRLYQANLSSWLIPYQLVFNEQEAQEFADSVINKGGEGAVIKRLDCDWVAGHKGYRAMKLVRGVSLDLLCTGVKYGKGKREGQIAALEFEYKGNKFYADLGKGWTDEKRKALTSQYEALEHPDALPEWNPVGKIWEVKALQLSSTGKALRLPKAECIRWDKEEQDV